MGTILAQGDFQPADIAAIRAAAQQTGQALEVARNLESLRSWLREGVPTAVLVCGVGEDASQATTIVRAKLVTPHVALIAVADDVGDSAFAAAMSWGADDVIRRNPRLPGLAARLEAAVQGQSLSFSPRRGTAILADGVAQRRVAFRRVLEGAGFAVRSVETQEELTAAAEDLRVGLWLVAANFHPEPDALVRRARTLGVMAKVILVAEGEDFEHLTRQVEDEGSCRILRGSAPADHAVFLANEMSRPELLNQRQAPRALYGTAVKFMCEGDSTFDLGYSYNVSALGIYVRTLAPPLGALLKIQLAAPGSRGQLELSGELAWRRPFGADGQATAPPGFGMKLTGPADQLAEWQHALAPLGG